MLILGSILHQKASHSYKETHIGLLILCKGGLRELTLVITLYKGASPRSEKTNPTQET